MKVSVLGPLEVTVQGQRITPSAPKLRNLVALLALRHDHVVSRGMLIEELWGDAPPISAIATLQTYVYQLRRLLAKEDNGGRDVLVTKPFGYLLRLDPDDLDLDVFTRLVEDGQAALADGVPEKAAELLAEALRLSSVSPLSDVDAGPVLRAHVNQMTERKLQAIELRIEADLQLGKHRDLIGELKALIARYPFHEDFSAKLMLALERCGRRPEALAVYQNVRRVFVDELGIEPSPSLRGLHGALLAVDSEPSLPPPATVHLGGFVRPAQLPPDTGDFAGRTRLVAELEAMLTGPSGGTGTRLVSIAGMAGAGKTALMIRVGHRIRPCFPDGQFHAELGGSTEEPADPGTVLSGFLRATGLTDRQLPHRVAERSQLFRSWTAERAILVVLDDAVDLPHIQPLLPAGPHCAVLISSRLRLAGLPGLRTVELDVPDIEECLELLGYLIGPDRLHAEPEAARTIVHLCGQNPLAIRAIAARLMVNPRYPLRRIVNRLADPSARLRVIGFGDLDPRARLTSAFRRLSMAARRMLYSLPRLGDTTFTPVAAAKLIAVDPATADVLIEELMDAAFLRAADLDEWGALTFRMPDLIRSFVLTVSEPEELASRGADGSVSNRYTLPNGAWLLGNVG